MKKNVLVFFLVFVLLLNSMSVLSVSAEEIEEIKTLNVKINKEYHDHGRFAAEDFPELELEAMYLISDYDYKISDAYYHTISYYFVLKKAITIDELKSFAESNPYVDAAYIGYKEPFEESLSLNVPEDKKITIKVGESLDLKFLGAKAYKPPFSFSYVSVRVAEYDDTHTYEPKDFPEVALSKVKHIGDDRFELYLQEPGFWNVIKAADALSAGANCSAVDLETFYSPSVFSVFWTVTDSSVAAFNNIDGKTEFYSGTVANISALKEGTTALSVRYFNEGAEVDKTYEIEVVARTEDNKPLASSSKEAPVDTDDGKGNIWLWIVLGLAGTSLIAVLALKKNKRVD